MDRKESSVENIIFEKSRRNLKLVYDRLQNYSIGQKTGYEPVIILAIGGYGRVHELLIEMGCLPEEIATFSSIQLSSVQFLRETHNKKVLLIKKINYTTNVVKGTDYSKKQLDLSLADSFEESLMVYKNAKRTFGAGKNIHNWIKPTIIILEDQSLNLQFSGHRFKYAQIGFAQTKERFTEPSEIVQEIKTVEAAEQLMFALYQQPALNELTIQTALKQLEFIAQRNIAGDWYFKPMEYRKACGNNDIADHLKDIKELGITQLNSNKRINGENARWIVIPNESFNFNGFEYKDEEDLFNEELERYEQEERELEERINAQLDKLMTVKFPLYMCKGYVGNVMADAGIVDLNMFVEESADPQGIELLKGATSETEYKEIKKHHLLYFLDGNYQDGIRLDDNYLGGKRLISIDIDDDTYTRSQLEDKLESQDLFGLIFPTPRYYYENSNNWRIILLADNPMDKDTYRNAVRGVTDMLNIEFDQASAKISQLMGCPLNEQDISIVVGSMVNVAQFQPRHELINNKVHTPSQSSKSLLDFNHQQAKLLRQAVKGGIPKGSRNESYRQIIMFLRDIQNNPEYAHWSSEAQELELQLPDLMTKDGLGRKEIELICRK